MRFFYYCRVILSHRYDHNQSNITIRGVNEFHQLIKEIMNLFPLKSVVVAVTLAIFACSKNHGTNTDFTKFPVNSREYKDEVAGRIRTDSENIKYTLKNYLQQDGQEYLELALDSKGFTATALVQVNDWTKLEGIRRTKGESYIGAELEGLQLDVIPDPNGAVFLYRDVERIVD